MARANLLIVADSERNADMLYAARTFVSDPFIWFTRRGQPYILVHDMELDRVRREARHCRVLPYSRFERRLARENGGSPPALSDVLAAVLREHRIRKVTVSECFPLGLARALRNAGTKVKLRDGPFFPERAVKSADEVKKISAALVMAEVGMAEGIHALQRSRPGKGKRLQLHQAPLTAERLRAIIDTAILQAGGQPNRTIVAGGRQGADPHARGTGPLVADQPVVIDIFPRSQRTGYHGDVTRTVVRGRATEFVRRMFAAVSQAQDAALDRLRHGADAGSVHEAAEQAFRHHGFPTSRRKGRLAGFYHGTGHGIGLAVHEAPRLGPRSPDTLLAGQVVAVEPGLYNPGIGGVRLEDVVLVTRQDPRNLTEFEKRLEI